MKTGCARLPPAPAGEVASGRKIAAHREKLAAYLAGERIYPVSLELDLTSRCSRSCPQCPSSRATAHWHLDRSFLDRLLGNLGGRATGLLLTGGEPTISPLFAEALAAARRRGFREIAVVTNGSQLGEAAVADALLAHASTIRLSAYDWENGRCAGLHRVLRRLESLRRRIESEKRPLQIGVSALTSKARLPHLRELAAAAASAGAHWIYFHPRCRNWNAGRPRPERQAGVLAAVAALRREMAGRIDVHISRQRYERRKLAFSAYHAAHFLLVVGADRRNYLGAEVKYQPAFAIADLGNGLPAGFLWQPGRLERIAACHSGNYGAIQSRHRGVLYSDYIEQLRRDAAALDAAPPDGSFRFPHIL